MRRLLIVTTIAPTLRGFLLPFARYFQTRGWQVDGMAQGISDCAECVETFDRAWNVNWSRNPLAPYNLLRAPRVVRTVVEREGYDLVHVHMAVAAFVTRLALRRLRQSGLKVVYTPHGFHFYDGASLLRNTAFLNLEKLAGRWTDYLVAINHDEETAACRHGLVSPDRVCYMPGIGVDTACYSPEVVRQIDVARVRKELGLAPAERMFLMMAEFIPRKRHRDVLRAFARLDCLQVHLALAGDGPLLGSMKQLATDLGIGQRVHFLGFRSDIPSLIRASIALLLPSEREGLPRSILEALSLEVPVIGSDIGGTRELLSEGGGLLVNLGDVEGLAKAMTWILEHPEDAKAMGYKGRQQVTATHDVSRIIALHEELYKRALKKGHREV